MFFQFQNGFKQLVLNVEKEKKTDNDFGMAKVPATIKLVNLIIIDFLNIFHVSTFGSLLFSAEASKELISASNQNCNRNNQSENDRERCFNIKVGSSLVKGPCMYKK